MFFGNQTTGRILGDERTHRAADDDEQNGTVEHILVEEAAPVGQDNVVAYRDGSQCRCGTCIAEAVHEPALHLAHAEYLLCGPCRQPFSHQGHGDHDACYLQCIQVIEEGGDVDEHADADEEVRDEQGVTYELQMVHQRRDVGDEAVQQQAHQEGAQDALHANEGHDSGS